MVLSRPQNQKTNPKNQNKKTARSAKKEKEKRAFRIARGLDSSNRLVRGGTRETVSRIVHSPSKRFFLTGASKSRGKMLSSSRIRLFSF
jgi:hypothetical protein